ncbi:MAG: hypothetical protein JWO11_3202 [Nocardioides sp.]|nr:hypothetical protein [Nocardioides sp.]
MPSGRTVAGLAVLASCFLALTMLTPASAAPASSADRRTDGTEVSWIDAKAVVEVDWPKYATKASRHAADIRKVTANRHEGLEVVFRHLLKLTKKNGLDVAVMFTDYTEGMEFIAAASTETGLGEATYDGYTVGECLDGGIVSLEVDAAADTLTLTVDPGCMVATIGMTRMDAAVGVFRMGRLVTFDDVKTTGRGISLAEPDTDV